MTVETSYFEYSLHLILKYIFLGIVCVWFHWSQGHFGEMQEENPIETPPFNIVVSGKKKNNSLISF